MLGGDVGIGRKNHEVMMEMMVMVMVMMANMIMMFMMRVSL